MQFPRPLAVTPFAAGMELADGLLAAAGAMEFVPFKVPGMPLIKQLTLEPPPPTLPQLQLLRLPPL